MTVLKWFYLALMNISQKWSMPLRDWKAALNRFTIQFEGADANLLTPTRLPKIWDTLQFHGRHILERWATRILTFLVPARPA